jgi:hypothetical protein
MAQAPVEAPPQPGGSYRRRTATRNARTRGHRDSPAIAQRLRLSEALRALNRERIGVGSELRCECGQPTCTETLPLVADSHRGVADRFVVMPAHYKDGVVVRASDHFFVVDSSSGALSHSQRDMR